MQQPSKAKVQKSLKNPRGSLREHSGLAKGSAGAQLLVSRRRPSELSCAARPLLCVGLWLCEGTAPRRSRPGWAVRVSYQARPKPCRPDWGAFCRPLRRKHRSIGSLPSVQGQDAIMSGTRLPGLSNAWKPGRSPFPVSSREPQEAG